MGRDRASRPEAKPLRLFVAADPPPRLERAIDEAAAPWKDRIPGARWLRAESRHITLKFLGETWPRLRPAVEEACRETAAAAEPFDVSLSGMGVFPGPSRARVLWVGIDDPREGLAALAAGLEERLRGEFPTERRGFTPHLTVARFKRPADVREHADALSETAVEEPGFTVDRLVLFRSHLGRGGAVYESLGEFELGG